jgi:hypothetical protein
MKEKYPASEHEESEHEDDVDDVQELQEGTGKVGADGMDTDQINKIMRKYPEYLGCIGSDQIHSIILPQVKPHSRICWVQNIEPSTMAGDHWISVLIDARPNGSQSVEYYNPLGDKGDDKAPKVFIKHIKSVITALQTENYLKFKQNLIPDQSATSSNCGEFSIHFLIDRLRGKPFSEASGWDKLGEKRIEEWKKRSKAFRYVDGFTQHGEGIKEIYEEGKHIVKHIIHKILTTKPRDGFSPSVRKLLEKQGNKLITAITVYRQPIKSYVHKILNVLSLGQFEQNLKNASYDQAFHLYMVFKLNDGTLLYLEKNHVIEGKIIAKPPEGESMVVHNVKQMGLNDFLNKGIDLVGKQKYFHYDSRSANCQYFCLWNLSANGMLDSSMKTFIYQDTEKILKNLGYLEKFNKVVTDIASKADTALYGGSRRKK